MEHRRPLFRCTPAQACFAVITACIVVAALILYGVERFKGYEGRAFLPSPADSQGYVRVDYVMQPASDAGLRINDRIQWRSVDLSARLIFIGYRWALPGKPIIYPIQRGNEHLNIIRIPKVDIGPTAWDQAIYIFWLQLFVSVAVLVVGTLLVLLRPSKVTWAWFFLSLWIASSTYSYNRGLVLVAAFSYLPPWLHLVSAELFNLLRPAAYLGLLVFVLYFPNRQPQGVSRAISRLVPYGFIAIALLYLISDLLAVSCFCAPSWLDRAIIFFDTSVPTLALVIALATYFRSRGVERQKIQWIAAATTLALAPYMLPYFFAVFVWGNQPSLQAALDSWVSALHAQQWLVLLYIAPPLAIAYTILRHRVYDIRFVLGRAIVLTIFTSFVVIVFALIDWIFVHKLEQTGLGVIAGILAVTTLGFTANAMHRRVDTFVDKALFKRRHLAKERLARLAHDLPGARSMEALDTWLVKEPLDAFNLASAALFRRGDGDTFTRENAIGWPNHSLRTLKIDEPPLSHLAALNEAARISWRDPNNATFPSADAHPALAMPVNIRGRLQAIVLYGPHEDGLDFDPDEIRAINGLMIPAAAAYDHLEAQELRREVDSMRAELELLRRSNEAPDLKVQPDAS